MDGKMKTFISAVAAGCFMFSIISSASIHTMIEMQIASERDRVIAAALLDMPLRQLAEVRI